MAPVPQNTAPINKHEEKANETDDVLQNINVQIFLSPGGQERTPTDDEGVILDDQGEHLFSIDSTEARMKRSRKNYGRQTKRRKQKLRLHVQV